MKRYIAYFDLLGFKEYMMQNSEEKLKKDINLFIFNLTSSLSKRYKTDNPKEVIPDLSDCNINCLNISDTVILWTKDDSLESCKELLTVAHKFNSNMTNFFLPVRGCVIYDQFNIQNGQDGNAIGTFFGLNYMYGKGLINAHLKTEQLNWTGTVIDNSVVTKVNTEVDFSLFSKSFAKEYQVPYKGFYKKEYALLFTLENEMNEEVYERFSYFLKYSFEKDGKSITPSVEEKLNNTLAFLRSEIKK